MGKPQIDDIAVRTNTQLHVHPAAIAKLGGREACVALNKRMSQAAAQAAENVLRETVDAAGFAMPGHREHSEGPDEPSDADLTPEDARMILGALLAGTIGGSPKTVN